MSPRARDEEAILRETMTALCRALGPGALVMRNEANALTSFAIGLKSDMIKAFGLDLGKQICALIQERFQRVHPSCKYGLGIGSSDLVVVYRGMFEPVEMKSEDGRQSAEQATFQRACERAGGRYHLARSAGEAVELVSAARGDQ